MARCDAVSPLVRNFGGLPDIVDGWRCDREAGHVRAHKAVRENPPGRETTIEWHDETTMRSNR